MSQSKEAATPKLVLCDRAGVGCRIGLLADPV